MIRLLVQGWQRLSGLLGVIGSVLVMGLVVAMVGDVLFRLVSRASVPGLFEVVELALAAAVYLGLPVTQRENGMIRVEMLTSRLSRRSFRFVAVFSLVLSFVVSALLASAATQALMSALGSGEARVGLIAVPTWPSRLAIVIGVVVLGGEILISLGRTLRRASGSIPPSGESAQGGL